ncbi:MAG TPA: hypothetical protein VGZ22_23670 [Isosphaeraceae bacterium]|nr:hypothetical protein [Isosphaeraceae bacterium]
MDQRKLTWHAKMKAIYERAATHPWEPPPPNYPLAPPDEPLPREGDPRSHGLPTTADWNYLAPFINETSGVQPQDLLELQYLSMQPGSRLDYGPEINDASLVHLRFLKTLRALNCARANVGDAGLAHLRGLTKLERTQTFRAPTSPMPASPTSRAWLS